MMTGIPLPISSLGGLFTELHDPVAIEAPMISAQVEYLANLLRKTFVYDAILRSFETMDPSWAANYAEEIRATDSPLLCAVLVGAEQPQCSIRDKFAATLAYISVHGSDEQIRQVVQWLPSHWPDTVYPELFSRALLQIVTLAHRDLPRDMAVVPVLAFARALKDQDRSYHEAFLGDEAGVIAMLLHQGNPALCLPICETLWSFAWEGDVPRPIFDAVPGILRAAILNNEAKFLLRVSSESYDLRPDVEQNRAAAEAALTKGTASVELARYIFDRRLITPAELAASACYLCALAAENTALIDLYDEEGVPLFPPAEDVQLWQLVHDFKMLLLQVADASVVKAFLQTNAFRSALGWQHKANVALLCQRAQTYPSEKLFLLFHYIAPLPLETLTANINLDALEELAEQYEDTIMLGYISAIRTPPPVTPEVSMDDTDEKKETEASPPTDAPSTDAAVVSKKRRRVAATITDNGGHPPAEKLSIADRVKRRTGRDCLNTNLHGTGSAKRRRRRGHGHGTSS